MTTRTTSAVYFRLSLLCQNTPMLNYIGRSNFRDDKRIFGIKHNDRFAHLYILGKTGTGKSSLLSNMIIQDAHASNGLCLIDPHGDLADKLHKCLADIPHIYLNLSDPDCKFGYNPLGKVKTEYIPLAVSGFMETLKSTWHDAWGVRMEHILRNSLHALMEIDGSTLPDILKLLGDKDYAKEVAGKITNPTVKEFFLKEFPGYSPGYRQDGVSAIQNKIGAFLSDPKLLRLVTTPENDLSLRRIMDTGQILLVNLAKGKVGSDSANLLGGMFVSTVGLAAFSRADIPEDKRKPFFLYVDEFQNFTTLAFVSMLSELRKYRLGLTLAHQYLHQLSDEVRSAIFGNVGSVLSFRVGTEDAPIIAKEMYENIESVDLLRLPNRHFYLKLLIDGYPSKEFSGETLDETHTETHTVKDNAGR